MSESTEYAQNAIDQSYEQTQPYIVQLVQRLVLTFFPPMVLAAVIGVGGRLILAQSIPGMATTLLLLIINIAVFYASWRFLDGRYNGTALFFLYASFSRERRELKNLIVESPDSGYTLRERADKLLQSAQDLIQAVANSA